MEPMTLGSPTGNVSPGFIPSFLLGEMAMSSPGLNQGPVESQRNSGSPMRAPRRVSFAPDSRESIATNTATNLSFSQSAAPSPRILTPVRPGGSGGTRKGPPTVGLFDTLTNASTSINESMSPAGDASFLSQSVNQSFLSTSAFNEPANNKENNENSALNTSFLEPDLEMESSLWVTVFGFPANMGSVVLSWLASCGMVTVRHQPLSSRANWMHLRFSCPAEARRALSKNRHLLGADLMLGVVPCTDKLVMLKWQTGGTESFKGAGGNYLFTQMTSLTPTSPHQNISHTPGGNATLNSSLRSLATSPTDLAVEPTLLPRRSTGVMTKAMDMLFGW